MVPLLINSLEPYAVHFLIVIANLTDFTLEPNLNDFQEALVSELNHKQQVDVGTDASQQTSASSCTVVKMQRATYRSHESFDVMALFEDSLGSRLDGQVVLKLFQGHEKNLSQITGNQIQDVSLADFSFDDRSDEVQFWRWATVITTAVCALSILLGIVLCCLMCCHDKKPKVTPASTFDNSALMVDLETGRVRHRQNHDDHSVITGGHDSLMSSVSRRPLVNSQDLYVPTEFKFMPVTETSSHNGPLTESGFNKDDGDEIDTMSQSISLYFEEDEAPLKNANSGIISGYSNRKLDFQRTGTFPRGANLTLYEKSLVHEAVLAPLEQIKPPKEASIVRKASSLQDLFRAVDSSQNPQGKVNEAYAGEDSDGNSSLFEEVGGGQVERPLPSFEESIAAFQKLEGRAQEDYTRTLPSKLKRVHTLTDIDFEVRRGNYEEYAAKEITENEKKKASSSGNLLNNNSFFGRWFN